MTGAYVKIENEANRRKALKSKLNREFNVKQQTKAQKTISSALAKSFRQSKTVIPLEETLGSVVRKLGFKNLDKPFEVTIQSWKVGNVKKTYKFNNLEHYKNWLEKVLNSGEVQDYEYKRIYHYGQSELLDLFEFARIGNVQVVSGGCNKDSRCLEKTLKSSHYEFTVYNPISRSNNCFFKCLEKITGSSVDIKQLRKRFQIPMDTPVDITQAYQIIKHLDIQKKIYIIDVNHNEELGENETYIINKDSHYYVVESFKEILQKKKKTKRGLLTFDFETRKIEKYYVIEASQTKSYLLQDTICGVYYNEYNVNIEKQCKTKMFITNENKSSARQFVDWLSDETKNGRSYNVIAHNGGNFDFYFIISCLTQQELKDCDIHMRGTTIISINYKGHLFKDSYCFMTFSLEKLSESF